jgi:hypothetical protein
MRGTATATVKQYNQLYKPPIADDKTYRNKLSDMASLLCAYDYYNSYRQGLSGNFYLKYTLYLIIRGKTLVIYI